MKKIRLLFIQLIVCIQVSADDCFINPFIKNYQENIEKQEIYFIKGIKLETVYHGMVIKVLEDLKINQINDTIKVWCNDGNSLRYEYSSNFNNNDTLIMIITKTDLEGNNPEDNNNIPDTLESEEDFMPIPCNISILKYKNDSIQGRILDINENTIFSYESFIQLITDYHYINELKKLSIKIFPNPTNHQIEIKIERLENQVIKFDLLNINGQIIDKNKIIDNTEYYDLSHLLEGIYLLRFYLNNNSVFYSYRIVKI